MSRTPIFTKYKVQRVFFTEENSVTQLMSINHPRFSDCFTCRIYNKVQALKSLYYISFSSVLYLTDFIVNSVTNEFFMFHSVNTVLLQLHFHSLFVFKTCFFSHNILSLISSIKSYIKILSLNICLVVLTKHYSPQILTGTTNPSTEAHTTQTHHRNRSDINYSNCISHPSY